MNTLLKKSNFILVCSFILISMLLQNCAPVFSELQGARTVGKGNFELTPSYSSVSVYDEGDSEKVQNEIGFQGAIGLSDKVDIRARYEYVWLGDGDGNNISAIGLGPKFNLIKDKLSISLPVGRALGEGTSESWEFLPTVLFSLPVKKDILDINISPKYIIQFCEECESLFAINAGLSISSNLNEWAIRPEFGLLYNPGETGHYTQFSIGVSKVFGKNKAVSVSSKQ
jgi:hypothetical protein